LPRSFWIEHGAPHIHETGGSAARCRTGPGRAAGFRFAGKLLAARAAWAPAILDRARSVRVLAGRGASPAARRRARHAWRLLVFLLLPGRGPPFHREPLLRDRYLEGR